MKNCPNKIYKTLFIGISFLALTAEIPTSQPIQLIPHKERISEPSSSLSSDQTVKGLWEGTPPSVIVTYFQKLPLRLTSPVLQAMRDKVLKEKYSPLLQDPTYEKTLFSALMGIGQFGQVQELLLETNLPEKETLRIDLLWLQRMQKVACEKITNLLRTSPSLEWKKQIIYCLYLNGEEERGRVAAELLNESSHDVSPVINSLFDPASRPSFDSTLAQSPFLLTVWCARGQEISEKDLAILTPASLSLIAQSEAMPIKTRLVAAQRALEEGNFKADDLLALLNNAPADSLLAKFVHELKSGKAANLLPLFEKVAQDKKLRLVAEVFKSYLSKIDPLADNLDLAPYMIRAFLSIEEKDLAQKWGTFFMRENPEEAVALLPLLHLAFPENKWGEPQLKAWQAYQMRMHPEQAAQHSYFLRRILNALGEDSGSPVEGEPQAPSWRQEKAILEEKDIALLDSAAKSKRTGEVFLLTLAIIGEISLEDLTLDKLPYLVRALNTAGLTLEARTLALEFLLAKGI